MLKGFGNDGNFFKDVVDMFISDYPDMLTTLQNAIHNKKAEILQRTAHSLKGMLRNFQAEEMAEQAFQLEKMGQKNEFDGTSLILQELSDKLPYLKSALLEIVKEVTG